MAHMHNHNSNNDGFMPERISEGNASISTPDTSPTAYVAGSTNGGISSSISSSSSSSTSSSMTISVEEFASMQSELVSLKSAKYEAADRERRYIAQLASLEELQQIKDKKIKVADVLAEKMQLKSRLDSLMTDFRQQESDMKALKMANKNLKLKLDESQAALGAMKGERNASSVSLAELNESMKRLKISESRLRDELASLTTELDDERQQKRALMQGSMASPGFDKTNTNKSSSGVILENSESVQNEPANSTENQSRESASSLDPKDSTSNNGHDSNGASSIAASISVQNLQEQLEEHQQKHHQQVLDFVSKIDSLKDQLSDTLKHKAQLEEQVGSLSKDKISLTTSLTALQQLLSDTTSELRDKKEKLETALNRVSVLEAERAAVDGQLLVLQEQHSSLQTQVTTLTTELEEAVRSRDDLQSEVERSANALITAKTQLASLQAKLQSEIELNEVVRGNLEKTQRMLSDSREETITVKANYSSTVESLQQQESQALLQAQAQLKEKQVALEACQREVKECTAKSERLQMEVDLLWSKSKETHVHFEKTKADLAASQKTVKQDELDKNALQQSLTSQAKQIEELNTELKSMILFKQKSQDLQQALTKAEAETEEARRSISTLTDELNKEQARCKNTSDKLEATEKEMARLSKDVASAHEAKEKYDEQIKALELQLSENLSKMDAFKLEIEAKDNKTMQQITSYESQLATLQAELETGKVVVEEVNNKLNDEIASNKILQRKNALLVKDFQRQLKQAQRRVHELETTQQQQLSPLPQTPSALTSTSPGATSNSADSPRKSEENAPNSRKSWGWPLLSNENANGDSVSLTEESFASQNEQSHAGNRMSSAMAEGLISEYSQLEEDNKMLLKRLMEQQRKIERQEEKIAFMEEHAQLLTDELQVKRKIINHYAMHEDGGAFGSGDMDVDKERRAKTKGIMASIFSTKPNDSGMTLALSLEMNKQFQAVLEDSLLKNIRLQESIDLLGAEIERLKANP